MFTTPAALYATIAAFVRWHEANVGTEIEIDEVDTGLWSATAVEMTRRETRQCEEWWHNHT